MHSLLLALTLITFTWQPPTGGVTPTGYKLYYGDSAGNYTLSKDVGNALTGTLMLDLAKETHVVVKAYVGWGGGSGIE